MIAAEGEQKASRALRAASDVITESAAALQLRYLQVRTKHVLTSICSRLDIKGRFKRKVNEIHIPMRIIHN